MSQDLTPCGTGNISSKETKTSPDTQFLFNWSGVITTSRYGGLLKPLNQNTKNRITELAGIIGSDYEIKKKKKREICIKYR